MPDEPRNTILVGDALTRLRDLPDGCVQTCVTSPPYWGLRDYGVEGQIGLEATPDEYVAHLVEVFRKVRRVLREDGTLWLNLGDSYAGSGKGHGGVDHGKLGPHAHEFLPGPAPDVQGLKPKDLVGIPWRVAFALQADGWYLRSDIIWSKPSVMPESVRDRPTKAHEYLFLLSKSERYFYDAEAIKEPATNGERFHGAYGKPGVLTSITRSRNGRTDHSNTTAGRNKRSVWTIATRPTSEAHFATFPPALVEPCVLAGSSPQACEVCGAPWQRVTRTELVDDGSWSERAGKKRGKAEGHHDKLRANGTVFSDSSVFNSRKVTKHHTTGWQPTCRCEHNTGTGRSVVLDPFGGRGTTGLVARQLGRDYLLIELNPQYARMADRYIRRFGHAARTPAPAPGVPSLWDGLADADEEVS